MDSSFWQYEDYADIHNFTCFSGERASKDSAGVVERAIFSAFGRYIFGNFRDIFISKDTF